MWKVLQNLRVSGGRVEFGGFGYEKYMQLYFCDKKNSVITVFEKICAVQRR